MAQTEQALYRQAGESLDFTAPAAITGGEVFQLSDGRAAVCPVDVASGALGGAQVCGVHRLKLTDSINILSGGRVYWDHSANKAHFKKVNDRDFYLGRAIADVVAGTDKTVDVALNVDPPYDIDIMRDGALVVPVGTQAVGGFGYPKIVGGAQVIELTATNEAQKIDLLSVDRFALGANAVAEAIFRIPTNGTSVTDLNIGVANGTHATDADSITESLFVHVDGGSTNLALESDDGTTEVAATNSTIAFTAGSAVANRVEVWFDLRDPAGVKIYIDGVRALSATTFVLTAAAGPLGLIAHLEKTVSTETATVVIDALRARLMET